MRLWSKMRGEDVRLLGILLRLKSSSSLFKGARLGRSSSFRQPKLHQEAVQLLFVMYGQKEIRPPKLREKVDGETVLSV